MGVTQFFLILEHVCFNRKSFVTLAKFLSTVFSISIQCSRSTFCICFVLILQRSSLNLRMFRSSGLILSEVGILLSIFSLSRINPKEVNRRRTARENTMQVIGSRWRSSISRSLSLVIGTGLRNWLAESAKVSVDLKFSLDSTIKTFLLGAIYTYQRLSNSSGHRAHTDRRGSTAQGLILRGKTSRGHTAVFFRMTLCFRGNRLRSIGWYRREVDTDSHEQTDPYSTGRIREILESRLFPMEFLE